MTPHGFKDARQDEASLTRWWSATPDASIGLACGASGWFVLDVDADKGGFESLAALETKGILTAADLDTFTTRTGSGGKHIVWKMPTGAPLGNSAGKLGKGLDTRGEGGYIIVPPSGHPSGNLYTLETNAPRKVTPQTIIDLLTVRPMRPESTAPTFTSPKGAIRAAVNKIVQAPAGERNITLSNQAWFLLHLVKAGTVPQNVAVEALQAAAHHVGLSEKEIHATLNSKLRTVLGA